MTLAEKLLKLRTDRGLSQGDLAEKMEVSRQSVSKWETGQSVPELDKIVKLADLFGVTVDDLVREGEGPAPAEPQVVYVERDRRPMTPAQETGVICEAVGAALAVIGIMGAGLLVLVGAALVLLGLPLLLAKKHPWLGLGWMAVALSLLVLNPHTSVSAWGLVGGLRRLFLYLTVPAAHYGSLLFGACIGVGRGTLVLVLLWLGWRGRKKGD